ncbi:GntR family transcriptional regulator [Streptomyces albireticuli]|uniref:GntR family transcriptional regulator n=1 Tax=Streptomyces albireticuli TaxID=1940 RepID=UPI001F37E051|nr:GntR family transcriptional regulator [Streptomyces albireticuli]
MNEQIAHALRAEIVSGKLRPGEKLPAVRQIAARFQVAVGTASKALQLLVKSGFIRADSTRGYFVSDRPEGSGGQGPSSEFLTIMREIESLREHLSRLDDRLQQLESVTRSG